MFDRKHQALDDVPIAIAQSCSLSPLSFTSARSMPFSFRSNSLGLPNSTCNAADASALRGKIGCWDRTHDTARIEDHLQRSLVRYEWLGGRKV